MSLTLWDLLLFLANLGLITLGGIVVYWLIVLAVDALRLWKRRDR